MASAAHRREGSGHERSRRGLFQHVAEQARALGVREAAALLRDAFARNDLLTYASAISYQLFFALIPLTLFGLGLLGGSGLQGVWTSDLAPELRRAASPAAFQVVDDTVRNVLAHRKLFWLTAGALLATWEVSGAVRAVMGVLSDVYDADRERSFLRRMAVSIGLAALIIVLLIAATATMEVAPRLIDGGIAGPAVDILRWPVTAALLWLTVTLVVRLAPSEKRPPGRVTFGSTLVIIAWLLSSAVFAWYLTNVANYASIFGALATVVVVLTYIYVSSIAFLTGVQIDALIQQRLRGAR
jgi:membrane protein